MTPDIISKLNAEIQQGITTEIQVVYLMAGIRKLLERQNLQNSYNHLYFYCNWALHPNLTNTYAQDILRLLNQINTHLSNGLEVANLPQEAKDKLIEISRMDLFREEMFNFMASNGIIPLNSHAPNGWVKFLNLYAGQPPI